MWLTRWFCLTCYDKSNTQWSKDKNKESHILKKGKVDNEELEGIISDIKASNLQEFSVLYNINQIANINGKSKQYCQQLS